MEEQFEPALFQKHYSVTDPLSVNIKPEYGKKFLCLVTAHDSFLIPKFIVGWLEFSNYLKADLLKTEEGSEFVFQKIQSSSYRVITGIFWNYLDELYVKSDPIPYI